ncbi:MAG TPA: cytochrome c biogenesis CcdA family protein [Solirubrobacteraceae bacterium]|nr:cytochrome c biogenesis CcdA family protein [Solirubrobacteraceae bacterium]
MDPASGIGIPVAFGAGLISFLSPCVLPLVPGYISAVSGVNDTRNITARRVIGPSLAFVATFSAIFIALGLLGQQAIRGALTGRTSLHVCGVIIAIMGLLFVLSPLIPRLAREWHVSALMQRAGNSGPILTGAAFAIAWTPCTGPTLGAIISAAGTSSSAMRGAFLLAIYCAGLGVPFLITALAFGKATTALNVVKRHYPVVIGLGGVVLIGMGVLIYTGQFTELNVHVSNALHTLGLPNFSSDT